MMEENAPYRFVMKIALALGLFLCAAGMSSCTVVPDSSERLSFASCKFPEEEALRLKEEAEVTVFHTDDGDIAYLAWETVCRDAAEVRERQGLFVPPLKEPITVHMSYLCTESMMLRAIQPLRDAGIFIRYVTAVNSMDAVPFVYAVSRSEK